jgi:hypothetical protein
MRPDRERVRANSAPLTEPDSRDVFRIAARMNGGRGQVGAPGTGAGERHCGKPRRQRALGGARIREAAERALRCETLALDEDHLSEIALVALPQSSASDAKQKP